MVRNFWKYGLLVLLSCSATLGCHRSAVQQKPPPDPLLISTPGGVSVKVAGNKPVDESSRGVNPVSATTYPQPPTLPDAGSATPAVRTVPLQAYRE